jgi:predicted esterase
VRLDFPRGSPVARTALSVFANAKGAASVPIVVELPRSPRGFLGVDVALPGRIGTDATDGVRVAMGKETRRLPLTLDVGAPVVVERALTCRSRLALTAPDARATTDVLAATLEYDVRTLGALADRGDPGVFAARARLDAFVSRLEAGKDPLREPGVLLLARRSSLDGEAQRFALHVPAGFDPASEKRYPLVVVLHGYGGYPERVMSAFLGTDSLAPHPRIDGFVLAPHAHGDAFYRGPGETEVMDLVDWATARYPIDPARVSVTGISMGGTGAAHFAFRYADRFAAAGALAGYHSYFVRRDVRGRPLRPWEWPELARHSPASFAENGLGTFLYLAQGTKDLPLAHTTSLASRYKELGYPLRETYPDTGHDVFRVAWSGGSLYPVLAKFAKDPVPKKVVLKTDSLRLGRRSWVRVTALSSSAGPGTITARVDATDAVTVRTDGVTAFELDRPAPHVAEAARLHVDADGTRIGFDPGEPVALHRGAGGWEKGPLPAAPLSKKPGAEGPIRDAFIGPLTFVYGTLDPSETLVARKVAEHFRARWSGNARFPVLADALVPAPRGRNYFLVGSRASNSVVRDLDSRLPFGIDGQVVRLGSHRIPGDAELGLCAVFPNPDDPAHVVVVVEGRGVQGLVRSMSLPGQLPDFIVFDSALAPAAGEQVLGSARVRAAGYFDRTWGVPPQVADAPLPASGPFSAVAKLPVFAWERRTLVSVEPAPAQ